MGREFEGKAFTSGSGVKSQVRTMSLFSVREPTAGDALGFGTSAAICTVPNLLRDYLGHR